ncbi:MAG: hypothetical protein PVJ60_06730 [Phycisphaerales bacterium]
MACLNDKKNSSLLELNFEAKGGSLKRSLGMARFAFLPSVRTCLNHSATSSLVNLPSSLVLQRSGNPAGVYSALDETEPSVEMLISRTLISISFDFFQKYGIIPTNRLDDRREPQQRQGNSDQQVH